MKKATDTAEYLLHKMNAESFGAAIIPIENKYSQGDDEHPLTIFIFYGAYVFAKKTPEACPIILVVDSAGGGDFEFFFLV